MTKEEDAKVAHLGFIQGIITRMGNNSFLLKGWSVTLVAALFALASKDADKGFMILAYFPVIVFWYLDAFFLHQEKIFRVLYDEVANNVISSDLFTLKTSDIKSKYPSVCNVFFSKTLLVFHGTIIFVVLFAKIVF